MKMRSIAGAHGDVPAVLVDTFVCSIVEHSGNMPCAAKTSKELNLIKTYASFQTGGNYAYVPSIDVDIWHGHRYANSTDEIANRECGCHETESVGIYRLVAGRIESGYPVWQNESDSLNEYIDTTMYKADVMRINGCSVLLGRLLFIVPEDDAASLDVPDLQCICTQVRSDGISN